jgi:hypothetical protein
MIKTGNIFILLPLSRAFKPQQKTPSPKENLKMKFLHFFLSLWVIFAFLNPDPKGLRNPNPIRIRHTARDC